MEVWHSLSTVILYLFLTFVFVLGNEHMFWQFGIVCPPRSFVTVSRLFISFPSAATTLSLLSGHLWRYFATTAAPIGRILTYFSPSWCWQIIKPILTFPKTMTLTRTAIPAWTDPQNCHFWSSRTIKHWHPLTYEQISYWIPNFRSSGWSNYLRMGWSTISQSVDRAHLCYLPFPPIGQILETSHPNQSTNHLFTKASDTEIFHIFFDILLDLIPLPHFLVFF